MKEKGEEVDREVAKLFLIFGSDNLKKLLKELGRGQEFYKTFNDSKISLRKIEKLLNA